MSEHGLFVLGAYAVALLLLGGLALLSWRAWVAAKADVARLEATSRSGRA